MLKLPALKGTNHTTLRSAIFITFSGNCKQALTFYQYCFGGKLQFELFEKELPGFNSMPVISGSLVADEIAIHASDLVPDEGRIPGNCMAVYLQCKDVGSRTALIEKLVSRKPHQPVHPARDQRLIEIIDAFEVRWMLGVVRHEP